MLHGGHQTSMDLSTPTIPMSWVWIPSKPSAFLPFKVKFCTLFVTVLKNDKKRPGWSIELNDNKVRRLKLLFVIWYNLTRTTVCRYNILWGNLLISQRNQIIQISILQKGLFKFKLTQSGKLNWTHFENVTIWKT